MQTFNRYLIQENLYSVRDVVFQTTSGELDSYYPFASSVNLNNIYRLYLEGFDNLPFLNEGVIDSIAVEIFSYFYARYCEKIAIIKIVDENKGEMTLADIREFWNRLFIAMTLTWNYYSTLLKEYNKAKDTLMSDIESITSSKRYFNDTPQNAFNESFEDNSHVTNFSKDESSYKTPLVTKQARLKEIQESYKMIIEDWLKDLQRVVVE